MPPADFLVWGWRISFVLSFIVIVAALIVRREIDDTLAFVAEDKLGTAASKALRHHACLE